MKPFRRKRAGQFEDTWNYRFEYKGKVYTAGGFPTARLAKAEGEKRRAELKAAASPACQQLLEICRQATQAAVIDQATIDRVRAILLPSTQDYATLADILGTYQDADHLDASRKTRKANANQLKQILRLTLGDDQLTRRSYDLTADLCRQWFHHHATQASDANQSRARSIKDTANSIFNSAKSIFTARARQTYQDAGLTLAPTVDEFCAAYEANRFRLPRKEYNPPGEATIRDTLADWLQLQDRNLFLALGHCLAFGLRKDEVCQADWSWHTVRHNWVALVETDAATKNSTGQIIVKALDPYYHQLIAKARQQGWWASSGPILDGTATERQDGVWRRVSHFLKAHGWDTQKKAHALRAYAGGCVAMKYGILEARDFLRHSNSTITEDHYGHFVNKFRPDNPDDLPWHYAKQTETPTLIALAS